MTNEFSGTVPRILNYIPLSSHDEHIHLSQVRHYDRHPNPSTKHMRWSIHPIISSSKQTAIII